MRGFLWRLARWYMSRRLHKDKGLWISYQANVAMFLHDRCGVIDYAERNRLAGCLLNLIFD